MQIITRLTMDGTLQDAVGANHGVGHYVEFTKGIDGKENGAVLLNGKNSYVEIPDSRSLHFEKEDFFAGMWVKFPEDRMSFGDLLCKFDDDQRKGFNLTVSGTSGGYTGMADTRNVYFGIDNGTDGTWEDCGKPCDTNTLISTMCVYNGELYVGIADAINREEACHVFKYDQQGRWIDCGRLGNDLDHHTAYSMVVHNGKLYAGTGVWCWEQAFAHDCANSHVFCYEGGMEWRDCGQIGVGYRVHALVSHKGELYASSTDSNEVMRYLGGKSWEFCGGSRRPMTPGNKYDVFRMDTLLSDGDRLFGAGYKRVFEYKGGTDWECIAGDIFEVTQFHKLQKYKGRMMAGTWPHGRVLRFDEEMKNVENTGELGIDTSEYLINEVNDLLCYNGKLYAGVIPLAEVYRYDGDFNWHRMPAVLVNEKYSPENYKEWNRVPSMAVYRGKLFVSASSCTGEPSKTPNKDAGRVFSMECGVNVSHDKDVGKGWHHIAVSKKGDVLKIFVDGKETDRSRVFNAEEFDLTNNKPLTIGFGCLNYLNAAIDDVVIAKGADDDDFANKLYRHLI